MCLRPTERDENPIEGGNVDKARAGEVDTALDESRPSGSLIRNARFEPKNVTLPFRRKEGHKHEGVRNPK
jgi:hypothetical protein